MAENDTNLWSEPEFQILYSPPSYDSIPPEKSGVYKFVWQGDKVVGVAWSDLATGAGLISVDGDAEANTTIRNYLSDLATVKFPASQAYVLIDSKAATSDERTGALQDAIDAANHVIESGEIPPEPEEDFDD